MTFTVKPEAPPLREDPSGEIRIGQTRVLLELVIQAFQDGATPEAIVQRYDTLNLPDVYAVIAYFLKHPVEVTEYLSQRERKGIEVRQHIETEQGDLMQIRERLLKHRQA